MTKASRSLTVVVEYDPDWARLFEEEKQRILEACGGALVTVEHVGSTSVPGLAAKPCIDMMPGLARLGDGLRCITPLVAILGYEALGEFGISDRLFFRKREPFPYHAHMFVVGHPEWNRHLLFRDSCARIPTSRPNMPR
jgi:GrpB-like predicted nucleotidyltransferase (UPF0157 family)